MSKAVRARTWFVLASLLVSCGETSAQKPPAAPPPTGAASDAPLPSAFKGYELYAWDGDDGLHWSLLTGTNREKSVGEITREAASEGELVALRGVGRESLERVIARVPQDTEIVRGVSDELPELSPSSNAQVDRALDRPD